METYTPVLQKRHSQNLHLTKTTAAKIIVTVKFENCKEYIHQFQSGSTHKIYQQQQ